MKLQLAVICEAAVEKEHSLSLLSTFDYLESEEFPFVKSQCAFVFQIKWSMSDEGNHEIRIKFSNEDGVQTLPDMASVENITIESGKRFRKSSYIINAQKLKFTKPECYTASVYVDQCLLGDVQLHVAKK